MWTVCPSLPWSRARPWPCVQWWSVPGSRPSERISSPAMPGWGRNEYHHHTNFKTFADKTGSLVPRLYLHVFTRIQTDQKLYEKHFLCTFWSVWVWVKPCMCSLGTRFHWTVTMGIQADGLWDMGPLSAMSRLHGYWPTQFPVPCSTRVQVYKGFTSLAHHAKISTISSNIWTLINDISSSVLPTLMADSAFNYSTLPVPVPQGYSAQIDAL